ncbi:MAG: hypothetical protein HN521_25920, partial [Candidatus Latescibacteria bacterium]|nr:hypothetical protein [Candidatus Latescibacterota bacterium]
MNIHKVFHCLAGYASVILCLGALVCGSVQAQAQEEIGELQAQVEVLMKRIADLEAAQAATSKPVAQATHTDSLMHKIEILQARLSKIETSQAGEKIAETNPDPTGNLMDGMVTAGDAPRSFRIPGTAISLRFGGYAKFDALYDHGVMLAGVRYFPDLIAVDGTPPARNDGVTQLSAAQTRFSLKAQAPTPIGKLSAFIEMDFFGPGNVTRLRHGIGQAGSVLAGHTWSTFMDLYSLP